MARMIAPYTGAEVEVSDGSVERWLARGFILVDGAAKSEPGDEPGDETVEAPVEEPGDDGAQCPDADSTISEIRAFADARGIDLPKKANKTALLAAIEEAVA